MKIDLRKACEGLTNKEARKQVTKLTDDLIDMQLDLRDRKQVEDKRGMYEASRIKG